MTILLFFFFFNDTATTEIYTLSLHDALPISVFNGPVQVKHIENMQDWIKKGYFIYGGRKNEPEAKFYSGECAMMTTSSDRKSTRLNSSHSQISYAVFCLKKKNKKTYLSNTTI